MAHQLVMNKRATPPPVKYAKKSPGKRPKEMSLADNRMIEFMDFVCDNQLTATVGNKEIVFDHFLKFMEAIGILREGVNQIKRGEAEFRQKHFFKVCEIFKADMNFFFRKEHTQMFIQQKESVKDQFLKVVARVVKELDKV